MRNFARFLLLGFLVAFPVAAQRSGGHGGGGFHGGGGGFHGGGSGFHGGGSGFRGGYGGFRGGYGGFRGGYGGFGRGFHGHNRFSFGFGLGYYPYWGWPYYYDYGYPYYGYPYYGYGNGYPAYSYDYGYSSAPVVVYQSNPAPVTVYESPRAALPENREYSGSAYQSNEKPIYLIAFKNQDNIRVAEAYWVTGSTLHFITLQHEQRQAPLDAVDRNLTSRLNRERHVDFRLPATE